MLAQVFKQACEYGEGTHNSVRMVHIPPELIDSGFVKLPCLECGGSCKVIIPDVPESMRGVVFEPGEGPTKVVTCTACKGSGIEYINLC